MIKNYLFIIIFLIFAFINNAFGQRNTYKRNIRHSLTQVKKINLAHLGIYKPEMLAVDKQGNIAMYDYGKNGLVLLPKKNYNQAKWLSQGLGGGPRQFRNPTDLKFGPSDKIWLTDPEQARISIWSKNGSLDTTFNHRQILPKAIAITRNAYIVMARQYSSQTGLFSSYRRNGNKISSFGILPKDLVGSEFYYDGEICADSKSMYFAGFNSGFIKKWNIKGKKIYSVSTIDPVPTAKIVTKKVKLSDYKQPAKVTKLSDKAKTASMGIDVQGKYLYDLFSGRSHRNARFIDVYNKRTGKYMKSYRLPEGAYAIRVEHNKIYLLVINKKDASQILILRIQPNE